MKKKRNINIANVCPEQYIIDALNQFIPWYVEYIQKYSYIYIQYGLHMFNSDPVIRTECLCRLGGMLYDIMNAANDTTFLYMSHHPNILEITEAIYDSLEIRKVQLSTFAQYGNLKM